MHFNGSLVILFILLKFFKLLSVAKLGYTTSLNYEGSIIVSHTL